MLLSWKVKSLFHEYLFLLLASSSMKKMKMTVMLSKEARGDGRKSGRKGRKGLIRAAHGHQDEDHFVKDFLIFISILQKMVVFKSGAHGDRTVTMMSRRWWSLCWRYCHPLCCCWIWRWVSDIEEDLEHQKRYKQCWAAPSWGLTGHMDSLERTGSYWHWKYKKHEFKICPIVIAPLESIKWPFEHEKSAPKPPHWLKEPT